MSHSAWVFCSKFAAYFQNSISSDHLWKAAQTTAMEPFCENKAGLLKPSAMDYLNFQCPSSFYTEIIQIFPWFDVKNFAVWKKELRECLTMHMFLLRLSKNCVTIKRWGVWHCKYENVFPLPIPHFAIVNRYRTSQNRYE